MWNEKKSGHLEDAYEYIIYFVNIRQIVTFVDERKTDAKCFLHQIFHP